MTIQSKTGTARLLLSSAMGLVMLTGAAVANAIRFWTTEEQPERLARQSSKKPPAMRSR